MEGSGRGRRLFVACAVLVPRMCVGVVCVPVCASCRDWVERLLLGWPWSAGGELAPEKGLRAARCTAIKFTAI